MPAKGTILSDALAAGTPAWALSGVPSTAWTILRGGNPLGSARAAGTLVAGEHRSPTTLLAAGALAHTAIAFGWAAVFAVALPRRLTVAAGALAGLAVAGLDLGLVGRHFPAIRALPTLPQVADHLAYGVLVATVVRRRRSSRAPLASGVRTGA